mgnify:FL=1
MKQLQTYLFSILLVILGIPAVGQHLVQDEKLTKGVLKNGFTYYIYPSGSNDNQSSIQLFVKAGSLQEKDSQRGLAHFVEHMAFNGSKNYPKNEVITYLESLGVKFGADLNAYTSYDQTVYKITVNTSNLKQLETSIDIIADWAFELSFDSLEIEKERGVVVEEWRTKQGASARLSEQYLPLIFHQSRYAERKPIGTLEILRNFKHAELKDFYNQWYKPNLLAIAVVSNQNAKDIEKYIKAQFGKAKNPKRAEERIVYSLPKHKDTLYSIATDKEENDIDYSYITKLPALSQINSVEKFKAQLVRSFFNGLSKKRFERLSQRNSIFKSGSMSCIDLMPNIDVSLGGASLFGSDIEAGIKNYIAEQQRILKYGFTSEEISDYRKDYLAQLNRVAQNTKTNALTVIESLKDDFFNGNTVVSAEQRNALRKQLQSSIDSLTIMSFIGEINKPGNTVVMLTGPDRLKKSLPSQSTLQLWQDSISKLNLERWSDNEIVPDKLLTSVPVPSKVVKKEYIAEIDLHKWELSNQTTVYLKQSKGRKDHIQLTGFRQGGYSVLDSSDFVNASFAQSIIAASGAGKFSRRALSKYLIGNSATAMMVLSKYREGLAANSSVKDMKTMFELLYLKWTEPRVDNDVFELQKRKALESTKNKENSITSQYNRLISQKLSGEENEEIDESKISNNLVLSKILPTYNKRFSSAKGFEFVIIGDFELDAVEQYVTTYLGGLPSKQLLESNKAKPLPIGENSDIVMKAGETDRATVNIIFQNNNVVNDYPEIIKYEIIQEILKVKLRENLREKNSGVYGVSVNVSATSIPSTLLRARIGFTCAPEKREFLVKQANSEIDLIAKNPAYIEKELENIKKQLIVTYEKQKNKETFWSAELRNHIYYRFKDWSLFTKYPDMVNKIQSKDISQAIKKLLLQGTKVTAVLAPEDK